MRPSLPTGWPGCMSRLSSNSIRSTPAPSLSSAATTGSSRPTATCGRSLRNSATTRARKDVTLRHQGQRSRPRHDDRRPVRLETGREQPCAATRRRVTDHKTGSQRPGRRCLGDRVEGRGPRLHNTKIRRSRWAGGAAAGRNGPGKLPTLDVCRCGNIAVRISVQGVTRKAPPQLRGRGGGAAAAKDVRGVPDCRVFYVRTAPAPKL